MQRELTLRSCVALGVCLVATGPASASFIYMQIEQVMAGVNGDTSAQAIQLRLRFPDANDVEFARIRAWDSAGANPITLIDFDTSVPNGGIGTRVLITSPSFANYTETPLGSDFMLTNLIPDSYLPAGRITYEWSDTGGIYWLLSFGGSGYTGPTTGMRTNDTDGEFGPPYAGPLPSSDLQALLFQGTALDYSTSNATDYALTQTPAVFTNNAGASSAVVPEPGSLSLFVLAAWMLTARRPTRRRPAFPSCATRPRYSTRQTNGP